MDTISFIILSDNKTNINKIQKKESKNNYNENSNRKNKNRKNRIKKNRNANHLFNEYMNYEEQKIYDLEFEIEMLNLIELQKKKKIYNYYDLNLSKEDIEIEESFFNEHNWYHECDICFENTRNGDCKCLGAVQKIDMVDFITFKSTNFTTGEDKITVIPNIVKQVPVLFYV